METRIIVCGGTDFSDYEFFRASLEKLFEDYEDIRIVSGHAKGADTFAEKYAADNQIPIRVFPAEWEKYGRAAGPIRNRTMLDYAKEETPVVVAFWDGRSPGTGNMLKEAMAADVECHIFNYVN